MTTTNASMQQNSNAFALHRPLLIKTSATSCLQDRTGALLAGSDQKWFCIRIPLSPSARSRCSSFDPSVLLLMMFIGTETLVTQLVHEISRMQAR